MFTSAFRLLPNLFYAPLKGKCQSRYGDAIKNHPLGEKKWLNIRNSSMWASMQDLLA